MSLSSKNIHAGLAQIYGFSKLQSTLSHNPGIEGFLLTVIHLLFYDKMFLINIVSSICLINFYSC